MILYYIVLPIVWVLIHILWRIEVIGLDRVPRDRPVVLAPNHISDLDPVFVLGMIFDFHRYRILAKKELFQNPVIGWFLGCLGAVPIDRGAGATETVNRVIAECRAGTSVLIFPEGTRSKDGKLGKLKSGAFVIAGQAGANLLPCRIIYDTPDQRMHLFCRMRICFGEEIPVAEVTAAGDDMRKQARAVRGLRKQLTEELEALYAAHTFRPALTAGETPAARPEADEA